MSVPTEASSPPKPAVLTGDKTEHMPKLVSALQAALKRNNIQLGSEDLENSPNFSVLPPRPSSFETRSLAVPQIFTIMVQNDGACIVTESGTDLVIPLDGLACEEFSE